MGGTETVVPSALNGVADQLDSVLTPLVSQAQEQFGDAAELNGPAFSQYGLELQATYPGVAHLALRDLQTKAQALESVIERLRSTAQTWQTHEQASTVRTNG